MIDRGRLEREEPGRPFVRHDGRQQAGRGLAGFCLASHLHDLALLAGNLRLMDKLGQIGLGYIRQLHDARPTLHVRPQCPGLRAKWNHSQFSAWIVRRDPEAGDPHRIAALDWLPSIRHRPAQRTGRLLSPHPGNHPPTVGPPTQLAAQEYLSGAL